MINVEHLSKYYGTTVGIKDVSFRVERGEVLGFLGPNGAGKTTLLRILTCCLPPTSGHAEVCGFSILDQPMEVRRRTGYLPERNPLYLDMAVREYLLFVARLKGVAAQRLRSETDRALERCGLEAVRRRRIGNLSKGYQQRVGIAQAILGDPVALILDEPTLGLDPQQIREIRQLLTSLGTDRTVILSSHILPEVSQLCNRIIVINRGELVAVDSPENLRNRLKRSALMRLKIRNTAEARAAADLVSRIDGVSTVREERTDESTITLLVESAADRDLRGEIIARLAEARVPVLEAYTEELSLEEIFVKLITEEVS